ncbi:F-box protein KIB4 [Hirschfeldia incana]|nr:F-box protein KIB4 [Hirschfeldia incana]
MMTPKVEMIGSNKTIRKDPMLILDLVILVMERLSFVDFHRARCVSSVWYSASKSCRTRQGNPWLVLFPADVLHLPEESIEDSCKLFDPIDHKSYTVRDLGSEFLRTSCLASYNSWFLMLDRRTRFYLLNMLTRERLHLPSLESMESTDGLLLKFKRNFDSSFTVTTLHYKDNVTLLSTCFRIDAAVLWVDERNRDYLVVWAFDRSLAYHKKGDDGWRVFRSSTNQRCVDMVFIESKLYVLVEDRSITAFDFSCGDSPMEYASFTTSPECYGPYGPINFEHLAMTLSGQVLAISGVRSHVLNIYKMDPKSSKWSIIESLGDEALLFDPRITVPAKDGVLKNCLYYSNDRFHRDNDYNLREDDNRIFVVNIQNNYEVQLFNHVTASSPLPFKDARWFVPTFGGK